MEVRKVSVVGAGDMGHGIAQVFAAAGYDVVLEDKFPKMLERAKTRIISSLDRWVERGRISKEQATAALSRIRFCGDIADAVSGADLVIEAVPESLELKREVLKDIESAAPDAAIVASNTSNMRISEIAESARFPERIVGMHFFNPPTSMKLVEVVPGARTSKAVAQGVIEIASKIGKTPVRVLKDSPGFIVNRLNAADVLLLCLIQDQKLASPQEVDSYMRGQGLPMGVYELLDFSGLDVARDMLSYFATAVSPEYSKGRTINEMVKEGRLGKKSGKGFYDWSSGRADIPSAEPTSSITLMDIFAIEINEAVKLIEERVAHPEDIEKAVSLGLNRPFGPISVARDLTNAEVKAKLEELAARFDCKLFAPTGAIVEGHLRDAIEGRLASRTAQATPPEKPSEEPVPASEDSVLFERLGGGVSRITLNRPRLNTMNNEVLDRLQKTLTLLVTDKETRVVIVTGKGAVFSAGVDLSQYLNSSIAMMEFSKKGARVMSELKELPQLTIAVLKGYALGGGLELALSCDLRVSTKDAELGFPELTRGLVPAWSGTQRLPRLIGISRAKSMILTSERISGKEAFDLGLVSRIVMEGDPDEFAETLARELAATQAPIAVRLAKVLLDRGSESPEGAALEMEAMAAGILFGTEDLREGISAFLGKRKPEFKGK
jgi:enoyl-CoA hydratase/3-hydroxyacyl-CoA dehydrogenase